MGFYSFNFDFTFDIALAILPDPYEGSSRRRNLATSSIEPKYSDFGFKTISFVHVMFAKFFLLPIFMLVCFVALFISLGLKMFNPKNSTFEKIFSTVKYVCFFNLPIRYVQEMFFDLSIVGF